MLVTGMHHMTTVQFVFKMAGYLSPTRLRNYLSPTHLHNYYKHYYVISARV